MTASRSGGRRDHRRWAQRLFASLSVLMLVMAAAAGAVTFASSPGAPEPIQDASPVGEVDAALCGGFCMVGAGVIAGTAVGYVAAEITDSGATAEELAQADAQETRTQIHSQALTLSQDQQIISDAVDNHLEDTANIARMEGKNAYIRALNNESSEAAARAEARGAIADYYAGRQLTIVASWNTSISTYEHMREVAINTSNVSGVGPQAYVNVYEDYRLETGGQDNQHRYWNDTGSATATLNLTNSSTRTVPTRQVTYSELLEGGSTVSEHTIHTVDPSSTGVLRNEVGTNWHNTSSFVVQAPNENYESSNVVDWNKYSDRWQDIEDQNQEVQDEVDTFVNNTYGSYQSGEINESDLVDPYLGAREYSPEASHGSWALRSMTQMGMSPPENMSSFGEMTVVAGSSEYSGVLLSDGLPANDTFETNVTYDPSQLTGAQMMVDYGSGQTEDLERNFTITSMENADGETIQNRTYSVIEYDSTDTQAYQNQLQNLSERQAQIEAHQQNLRNQNGGGLMIPGFGTIGIPALLAALALLFALLAGLVAVTRS